MDSVLRIAFYVVVGAGLAAANVWYIQSLVENIRGGKVAIAPFAVFGTTENADQLGSILARMLETRLRDLQTDLERLNPVARSSGEPSAAQGASAPTALTLPILPTDSVGVLFSLQSTVDINVSVAGVEVGRVIPWLQQLATRKRTLTFSAYYKDGEVVVSGDIDALLDSRGNRVWLATTDAPDELIDSVATEVPRRRLIRIAGGSRLTSLSAQDFRSLLRIMVEFARLDRQASFGRSVQAELAALLPEVEKLVSRVPPWYELTCLAAYIAANAGNRDVAVRYEEELKRFAEKPSFHNTALALLRATISKLEAPVAASGDPQADFVRAASEYARRLGLPGPDPPIAFVKRDDSGAIAVWNEEQQVYEVDTASVGVPGLPRYIALQGRFLSKNIKQYNASRGVDLMSWNEFRHSLVDYMITTEPDAAAAPFFGSARYGLFNALRQLQDLIDDAKPVRALALALLDRFDSDWLRRDLLPHLRAVNKQLGVIPEAKFMEAFPDRVPGRVPKRAESTQRS